MPKLLPGTLIKRPNRFLAIVKLDTGEEVKAFVADPGRLTELLFPGVELYLAYSPKEGRKTNYDLSLVKKDNILVSVDSRVPNKLIFKGLQEKSLAPFVGYEHIKKEPSIKKGRLDFLLTGTDIPPCYIEVKSCTLVKNGLALFPDAPTERGARHLKELIQLKNEGYRSCVIFVIQHPKAKIFAPNEKTDPAFAQEFYNVLKAGIEVYPYRCEISTNKIQLKEIIPIVS